MIKRITCYLIFYVCIFLNQKIQAQTYVIPDVNFKNYLVANIPSVLNSNQDLIINSAKNYTGSINCSGLNIQDLSGLQYFYKLTSLNCYNNKLSSLPALDSLKQIQFFWVYNNYLTSLPNVNHMVNLQTLNVKNNLLTSLPSLTGMTALKSFDCSINKLKTLPDLNSLLNLQELYCYINSITTVPAISNLSNLKIFNIENNAITLLPDISQNTKLEILQFDLNQIEVIPPLTTLVALKQLIFSNNTISVLPNLFANPNLTLLMGSNNQLTSLPDLSGFSNLTNVELAHNQLSFEDILPSSNHPQFTTVFHIQPQDSLNVSQPLSAIKGSTVSLFLNFDLTVLGNIYKWYKYNTFVTTTNTPILTLNNLTENNAGIYTCSVTNSATKFSGMTLYALSNVVSVEPCIKFSTINYEIVNNDCVKGTSIQIDNSQIAAPNTPLTYSLIPLNNQSVVMSKSTLLNDVTAGRYSLTISDSNNCSIELRNYIFVPVPTGCMASFTPNGDGLEDSYFIDKSGTAKIYNKTGMLVRTINTPAAWDGSDDSGKLCPMGYYIILIDGKEKTGVVLIN
jgi:internalin A